MYIDNDLKYLVENSEMKSGNNYGTGMLIVDPTSGKILLGKRTDTHNMCSPGGKVEIGESPLQGVCRETLEESNIKVNSAKFYDYEMHTAENGKNWVSFMFLSDDYDASEIKNQETEVEPWDWYTVAEALEMDLFPPTRKSIERALEAGVLKNGNGNPYDIGEFQPTYELGQPDGDDIAEVPVEGATYPRPQYIPYVEVPTSPFHDSCCCAYSFQEPGFVF